jgi:hypothetical protein
MSDNTTEFVDNRTEAQTDPQTTLEVGEAADRTDHRDGEIGGSDSFEDHREESRDSGEQSQLFADVDENQATLGGEKASQECLFQED